jgi:hypothetical protein
MERVMSPIQRYNPVTLTDMWEVPANVEATISMLVCNQNARRATFSLAIAPNGDGDSEEHYLCKDTPVDASRPFQIMTGMTVRAGTVVRVKGSGFSFQLFRIERTFV